MSQEGELHQRSLRCRQRPLELREQRVIDLHQGTVLKLARLAADVRLDEVPVEKVGGSEVVLRSRGGRVRGGCLEV